MTAGPPEIQSTPWTASVPLGDESLWYRGTRTYMTISSAIHVSAGERQSAILHDQLRLTLGFRTRRHDIADVRERAR
jgi:hypothetical protein